MRLPCFFSILLVVGVASADVRTLENGTPAELRGLAEQFEHGEGVRRNYFQAHALYCLAAMQGDAESLYNLGWMYANGRGVKQDDAIAASWLREASRQGIPQADSVLTLLSDPQASKQDGLCPYQGGGTAASRARYEVMIRVLAPEFGLDPELVVEVVRVESNFDPRALSPKGAQGLMQLMPSTASRFGVRDPWNPVQNLLGGMAYLTWLTDRYQGDLTLVLAAYNAGEGAVDSANGVPAIRETRHYVTRILTAYPLRNGSYRSSDAPDANSILIPAPVSASLNQAW